MPDFIFEPTESLHQSRGSFPSPVQDREAFVQESNPQIAALLSNAELLFKSEEKDLGFALLAKALSLNSHHHLSLKKMGAFHFRNRKWNDAIRVFEQLLHVENNFENLCLLGEAYAQAGRDLDAQQTFEAALLVATSDHQMLFDVHKNLGNIYCRQGDFHEAEEQYFKAFTLNPNSDVLQINLGTLEIQKDDFESAQQKFRHALELNPENDRAWVGLALVHDKKGDFHLAFANIENAVDLAPGNRTATHILANWCVRDHRIDRGIEALQNYLATVDVDHEMSLVLIHFFCQLQQWEMAHLEIERVLLWDPANEQILQVLEQMPKVMK